MRAVALVLVLATGSAGCAHRQLTNQQVAMGVIGVVGIVGLVLLYSAARENCMQQTGMICNDQRPTQ